MENTESVKPSESSPNPKILVLRDRDGNSHDVFAFEDADEAMDFQHGRTSGGAVVMQERRQQFVVVADWHWRPSTKAKE